jgi:hypothetical protein
MTKVRNSLLLAAAAAMLCAHRVEAGGGAPGPDLNAPVAAPRAGLLLLSAAFAVSAASRSRHAVGARFEAGGGVTTRGHRPGPNHNRNLKPTRKRSLKLGRKWERSQQP